MTHTLPLSRWQRAAALATEGVCLLPPLLTTLWSLWRLPQPPLLPSVLPAVWQPYVSAVVLALLYGAVCSPLRLWRVAVYRRLCDAPQAPQHDALRQALAAVGWRWRLWWRRAYSLVLATVPAALLWGYGSLAAQRNAPDAQPLFWLLGGGVALVCGIVIAAVWQCRYALAPLFILDGFSAEAAMALSARRMRSRIGAYINFLGGELPRLLACVLVIPAVWLLPTFRRRRLAVLTEWMQPTE